MATDNRTELFGELRSLLLPYSKKLVVKQDTPKAFYLCNQGKFIVNGREYPELFFAAAIIRKNFVGFYFFPIYTHPKDYNLDPEVKKLLKGKSCFHVKKMTPELKKKIAALLKTGYANYRKCKFVP